MISRNQIRQAAVQFLYGVAADDGDSVSEARMEAFWDILLEPDRSALNKARAKAVNHLTRDHADKAAAFRAAASDWNHRVTGDPRADSLRDSLHDLQAREDAFAAALADVRGARKNDPDNETDELAHALASLKLVNETLIRLRARFLSALQDSPDHARHAAALVKQTGRLQEIGMRINGLEHPNEGTSTSEYGNVIELTADIDTLQREAGALIEDIVARKSELDSLINSVVENFSRDRIGPVERAVIRIAAYELKYKPELPTAVIAAEAIRLAERFSITEAPRFINGVLAGIARTCREGETALPEEPADL